VDKDPRSLGFHIVDSQKNAVINSGEHSLSVTTGGAGVDKIAVTKVITDVLVDCGEMVMLSALSVRAVMRLRKATGSDGRIIAD